MQSNALDNTHRLLLEALRHREQEIFRYLAILGPAVGGFIWLLQIVGLAEGVFVIGTASVLLLFLLGTVYALALGYNYRYITLQLKKFEVMLEIDKYMLKGWLKCPQEFLDRYKICCSMPWCTPPEIVKVFWLAFLMGIPGVTLVACLHQPTTLVLAIVIPIGAICLLIGGLVSPYHLGKKLHKICREETDPWKPPQPTTTKEG